MFLKRTFLLAVALAASTVAAFGQASSINGQITGTVTDAAGASVPSAKVIATNTGTGYTQTVETDSSGLYRLNVLPLGSYDVRVEGAGFAPVKNTGIELNAGAT